MEEAKKHSRAIRQEAEELLASTKLQELLGRFGEVDLGGSYAYDLMVDRDLDFGVAVKEVTPKVRAEIAGLFASQPWAYSVNMTDRVNFKPLSNLSAPMGLFLNLTIPFPVNRWNVDVWFLVTDHVPEDATAKLIASATPEQKDTILKIKYELMQTGKKEKGVTSTEIYEAVINKGLASAEEFHQLVGG